MNVVQSLLESFESVTATEWVAAGLALGYLLLAIRQSAWCWGFAIASAALYLVVFTRADLYMQAALQVYYIGMGVYGWRSWSGTTQAAPVSISRWSLRNHVVTLSAVALVTGINGALIARADHEDWVPYVDAAIAWASVVATWMVTRKVLENWLYWIVLDAAMVLLAAWQGLAATAVLFALYTLLAVRGYVQWRRDALVSVSQPA